MSSDYTRGPIDAWSRFVSYCSLVVAIGTLGWVYFGSDSLPGLANSSSDDGFTAAQANAKFDQEVAARRKRDEELRQTWQKQQQDQLDHFKQAANELLAEYQSMIDSPGDKSRLATSINGTDDIDSAAGGVDGLLPFPTAMEANPAESVADVTLDHESNPSGATDAATVDDKQDQDAPLADGGPAGDEDPAVRKIADSQETATDGELSDEEKSEFLPLLAQVHQTRRPEGDGTPPAPVTIRNRGGVEAKINRVEFIPLHDVDAIFEVEPSTLPNREGQQALSVVFLPQDNMAVEKGKHGVYSRELTEVIPIPAGQDVHVHLAISNPTHLGWAFRGKLKITYNGIEPLVIDDAELVFVDIDEPVIRK